MPMSLAQTDAERALQESETRFRNLADAAPVMIWMIGPQGEHEFVNRAWREFAGPNLTAGEWLELVHPDDGERLAHELEQSRGRHTPMRLDARWKSRHGQEHRWLRLTATSRFDDHGVYCGIIGSATDIHVVREAEAALARRHSSLALQSAGLRKLLTGELSEGRPAYGSVLELLGEVTEAAHVALHRLDEYGLLHRVATWPSGGADDLAKRVSLDEAFGDWQGRLGKGMCLQEALDQPELAYWKPVRGTDEDVLLVAPILLAGVFRGVVSLIRHPGADPAMALNFLRSGATAIGAAFIYEHQQRDIHRLAQYSDQNPFLFLELSLDLEVRHHNEASRRLADQLSLVNHADLLGPELRGHLLADPLSPVAGKTVRLADRVLSWTIIPLPRDSALLAYGADTTRVTELERQLQEAERREQLGGQARRLGHDFANVLSTIRGHVDLAFQSQEVRQSSRLAAQLHEIEANAQRGAMLSRQLLAASGVQALQPRAVDLNELLVDLHEMAHHSWPEEIEFTLQLTHDLPLASVDPAQVEQALDCLLQNAREAISPSPGQVELRSAYLPRISPPENVPACARGFIALIVEDSGSGLPSGTGREIFDPLYTTKGCADHSGLGLTIAQRIALAHGGWVHADSLPRSGARFTLYLPAQAPNTTDADPEEPAPRQAWTVLAVEDDPRLLGVLEQLLRKLGHQVHGAGDVTEALAQWKEHHDEIGVLLTDVVLGAADNGVDLAHSLLRQKPWLNVIFTSGYGQDFAEAHFGLEAPSRFLPKPYTTLDLAQALRELTRKAAKIAG